MSRHADHDVSRSIFFLKARESGVARRTATGVVQGLDLVQIGTRQRRPRSIGSCKGREATDAIEDRCA